MNTYKCVVKVEVTTTIRTTKDVIVEASDADKAKLQLEAMYGKANLMSCPTLVYSKC